MGALNFFKSPARTPARFPSGSYTVDRSGGMVVSTLPGDFSAAHMGAISQLVLATLQSARELGVPLAEITVHYAGLQIRARDLAGGAIIFLTPREF